MDPPSGCGFLVNTNLLTKSSSFLSSLKETKQRKVQKRPELRGRNTNSSNHSMNSLRSNSISYFVPQIAFRNPRLNIDSKNLHSSKDLLVRNVFEESSDEENMEHRAVTSSARFACRRMFSRSLATDIVTREKESNPQNNPHEEVFIGCTIIGIFFDSCIA